MHTQLPTKGQDMNAPSDATWYSPEVSTFGDRLSGAREAACMTQEQLAQKLGVKLKTLRAWEQDLSEPRANKLSMLAGLLNVSLSWLLTGQGDGPEGPDSAATLELSPDMRRLLSDLTELHGEMARAAERMSRIERQLRASLLTEAGEKP